MNWPEGTTQLDVEQFFIRHGGKYKKYGVSLFHHMKAAMTLCWPDDHHHRWSDLLLQTYCDNEITVVMGCGDSGKTWTFSKIALTDYWAAPHETLWLISTTEGRGSELRCWGAIKDLFNMARARFPNLEGNPLDYIKCISTDSIEDDSARSLRRGMIVVPCKTGGTVSGLGPYIGIKAPRLRHFGDEVPMMSNAFLNAYSNWYGKENFKGCMTGNFMETDDPLGVASEPEGGWADWKDEGKTQTWRSKFYKAMVVALDGRDSPNFDQPLDELGRPKYRYLISNKKLEGIAETRGKDSWEYHSQGIGKPVRGMDIWRVLSRDYCTKHDASGDALWRDSNQTKLYSLDPAYGLGDRCVGREMKFGESVDGQQILWVGPPEIIPIKIGTSVEAEPQIAEFVVRRLEELGVDPSRCGFDSFGRGTLAFEFAKLLGKNCPVPIDSSAQPTKRPVRSDFFIEETDPVTKRVTKRLKRCDEHYTKFVTEMWFSVREAIGCGQVKNLDGDTISEGCLRKFTKNRHGKLEVEPKDEMKLRPPYKSPDLMDNLAIGLEMARRLGFRIQILGDTGKVVERQRPDWLRKAEAAASKLSRSRQLKAA